MTDIEKELELRSSAAKWKALVYGIFVGVALLLLAFSCKPAHAA